MTAGPRTCVIIGASLAGARAAEGLRQAGFDGRVVLVGAEPERPYSRPPLSKDFLLEGYPTERLYLQPADYYEEQAIEQRFGTRAVRLDPHAWTVELDSGERLRYDRLLIATGARARRLDVPGADLEGICYLRTIADAERLRAEMGAGRKVVIVGAGFIGAEIAAACRRRAVAVTMLEVLPAPLQRALGVEMGEAFARLYREDGIDLRTGEGIQSFRGTQRVAAVVTSSGHELECDFAVVGVGVVPETRWLEGAGITLDNGVVVDEYCESSVPGVFAAGDVANWWHPVLRKRLRVEHETNAQNQGITAAANMLGERLAYDEIPFVWSDQGDLHIQMVGHPAGGERVVIRGSLAEHSFTAFYVEGSRLTAALSVNRTRDVTTARRLIRAQTPVDADRLADEQVELRSLLGQRAG